MINDISTTVLCFIACHGGPADHFATYSEVLAKQGYEPQIYAADVAIKKFEERGIQVDFPFSLRNLSPTEEDKVAEQIAKTCSKALAIITDIGHAFDIKLQKALAIQATQVPCLAYYDNPESFVPGGYSSIAAEVIQNTQNVLFANENLVKSKIYSEVGKEIDLNNKKRFAIGYYPINQAEKIANRRATERKSMRAKVLAKADIEDKGQNMMVYFGGNNQEYFSHAFPAFLCLLAQAMEQADFSSVIIMIQQHPGAKAENLDAQLVLDWLKNFGATKNAPKIIISHFSSDEAQIVADAALYYQTSMGPQFVLANIPTIQIGHETYEDILVSNHLAPSITHADQFANMIENWSEKTRPSPSREVILKSLGFREDWPEMLNNLLNVIRSQHKG